MSTLQQLALDSGITPGSQKVNITINATHPEKEKTIAFDSNAFVSALTRSNPVGRQSGGDAFGMKFPTNEPLIFMDDSLQSSNLRNHLAMDDTYEYNVQSNGVPNVLTTVWTTKFFKQIFQSTPFREMTTPDQQGTFGTTAVKYPLIGASGQSKPYSDFSGLGDSSVNLNYLTRSTVTLERTLVTGDLQIATMAMAKVDYSSWLREYVATLITLDQNNIGFSGYTGLQVFGLINDPSLNAALTAGAGQWMVSGTYASVITDITTLVQSVQTIGAGQVDTSAEFIIGLPPVVMGALNFQNSLGTMNVRSYIESIYPKVKFIQVQNYTGTGTPLGSSAPNYMQVIFKTIGGQETALGVFSTLYNSHGVKRELSSFQEKVSYVLSGMVPPMPVGIGTMTGI